ncbi:unnamed protein product [Pleuronectes platessa]|uniref:Uncharacterized protein n=1 Tax=Pleuronectes platessa TaxID=8262 RepID=A0A9N7TQB0_PLEPL|nr:unnamed protein product [Pleuronectes platessa]
MKLLQCQSPDGVTAGIRGCAGAEAPTSPHSVLIERQGAAAQGLMLLGLMLLVFSFSTAPPTAPAQREQQKLIHQEEQRRWVRKILDSHWKVQRTEEEERCTQLYSPSRDADTFPFTSLSICQPRGGNLFFPENRRLIDAALARGKAANIMSSITEISQRGTDLCPKTKDVLNQDVWWEGRMESIGALTKRSAAERIMKHRRSDCIR